MKKTVSNLPKDKQRFILEKVEKALKSYQEPKDL